MWNSFFDSGAVVILGQSLSEKNTLTEILKFL